MSQTLKDKSLLIFGAASGIGAACARLANEVGAKLLLADADAERGEALAESLNAVFLKTDICSEAEVKACVDKGIALFGGIDCAVNCAGITGEPSALEETELSDWQRVIDVNLTGTFLCLKHELKAMKAAGGGSIVNVSSGAGLIAANFLTPYTASKHGILGLTKTAVKENPKSGIRINSVLPGSTRTPMMERTTRISPDVEKMVLASIPCGRMSEPEEQARAVLWLLSDEASYISGESLVVDNGGLCR